MFYLPTFTSHIFKPNVCKYTIHGTYGISECPQFVPPYIYLGIFDMAHEGMGKYTIHSFLCFFFLCPFGSFCHFFKL